jgi:hypothetical protein
MSSPEQVDLIYSLVKLSDVLKRVSADALSDQVDGDGWFGLAELLAEAARECRQQVPLSDDGVAAGCRWVRKRLGAGVTGE